jgi:hypothetical protein
MRIKRCPILTERPKNDLLSDFLMHVWYVDECMSALRVRCSRRSSEWLQSNEQVCVCVRARARVCAFLSWELPWGAVTAVLATGKAGDATGSV